MSTTLTIGLLIFGMLLFTFVILPVLLVLVGKWTDFLMGLFDA